MNARILNSTFTGLVLAAAFHVEPASAALAMQGTRVIYPAEKREIALRLENDGDHASIVQAWIDDGDAGATPSTSSAPFVIRPPIFRLDAGRTQLLRVAATAEHLPQEKESLYWFNAREVPTRDASKTRLAEGAEMNFIVRTRVKLLYRPEGLTAQGARQAPGQLNWSVQQVGGHCTLVAANPSRYYVNLNTIRAGRDAIDVGNGAVAPMSETRFNLSSLQCAGMKGHVSFQYINDHGGVRDHEAVLNHN